MNGRYILNADEEPVECEDLLTWCKWMQTANRHVVKTKLSGLVLVSTVFLGLDHGFSSGPPVLWETMIFCGKRDGYRRRYTSRAAAIEGHAKAVRIARGEEADDE